MSVSKKEIALARNGRELLSDSRTARLVVDDKDVELSPSVAKILATTLLYVASGRSVVVVPESAECTTQQAADMMMVSRPFLVKLLESGEIAFRKVGTHRRVSLESLLAYKERIDEERLKSLEKLTAEAQELDLGY